MIEGLGNRIVEARQLAGFGSRRAFAKALELPYETLWRYESGRRVPGVDALALVARVAGVRMEWLVTGDGPMGRAPDEDVAASTDTAAE